MYKILRIVFCVLAVAIAAVAIFIFIYLGWVRGFAALSVAFVSGALMVTFKQLQEIEERKNNPPPPEGDFITGRVDRDDNQP